MIKKPSTKELLSASLHELLQEMPFSKITIKKITDNCGLTATTFYNHFEDKYALALWGHDETQSFYVDQITEEYSWYHACRDMLYAIKNNAGIYSRFMRSEELQNSFTIVNYSQCEKAIKKLNNIHEIPEDVIFSMRIYFYGETTVVTEILSTRDDFSPEHLAYRLLESMPRNMLELVCPSWDSLRKTLASDLSLI